MLNCEQYREQITGYVDNQLTDTEISELQQHLRVCNSCRQLAIQEQQLHELLKSELPLFKAPESLKQKVQPQIKNQTRFRASHISRSRLLVIGAVACLLLTLLTVIWQYSGARNNQTNISTFALLAVDTHLRRTRNQLPLEIVSESPEVVSKWFSDKVNFHFELPNYPVTPGCEQKYVLEGARLVSFNNDYAANVSYRMNDALISLVVIADNVATPSGGKEIKVGDIRFHIQDYRGFHVITWSHRSLTYALVSDLTERQGQDSCMVCHQETEKERITLQP